MNFYARRFNLYLLLLLVITGGCSLFHKKKPEKTAGIRVHVEVAVSLPGQSQPIHLPRSSPVEVIVGEDPVLTEQNLIAARLMDSPGGFSIQVKFDETGTWALEQATAANPGKHLVVFGQWGQTIKEGRWLAAPLISRRIGDGVLTFTPDASREESVKLVDGLNNTAKIIHTGKQ